MKNILIQIGTEFHYMVALSIIEKYYSDSDFEIYFLVNKNPLATSNRLDNVQYESNHKILYASYEINTGKYYPKLVESIRIIKETQFFHFIGFINADPLFVYLTSYFKKKHTLSYLAPDGMIAYVKFNKLTLRSRILNTVNSYKFFWRYKLSFRRLWFTSWEYGRNGYYDFIYSFSPKLPYLKKKTKIIEIEYALTPNRIISLYSTFKVPDMPNGSLEKVVLIVNERHSGMAFEKDLVELIQKHLNGYQILFKKHPNTSVQNLDYLEGFPDVKLINYVFPVELLIAQMKNSVIISSYSTGLLYYNKSCSYFWTYPIVEKYGELRKPINRYNPTRHIKVISAMAELTKEFEMISKTSD